MDSRERWERETIEGKEDEMERKKGRNKKLGNELGKRKEDTLDLKGDRIEKWRSNHQLSQYIGRASNWSPSFTHCILKNEVLREREYDREIDGVGSDGMR